MPQRNTFSTSTLTKITSGTSGNHLGDRATISTFVPSKGTIHLLQLCVCVCVCVCACACVRVRACVCVCVCSAPIISQRSQLISMDFVMLLELFGLMTLVFVLSHPICIEKRKPCSDDFIKKRGNMYIDV